MTERVLIVDDEPRFIQSLKGLFASEYEIISTLNSAQAESIAAAERPQLILLDLTMPEMNGFEVIRKIKQHEEIADIPIIVATGLAETTIEIESLRLGAVDFITKPIAPEIVKARVHTHVELKRRGDLLRILSYQDALTGIPNRRSFDKVFEREHRRAA